jgi:hypothetical protein
LQSAGTTAITVDTSQNVGIGTTSPATKLDVLSSTDLKVRIKTSGASSTAGLDIAGANATVDTDNVILYQGGSKECYLYNRASSYMVLGTANTERMRILSGGQVCVATTSSLGGNFNVDCTNGASFSAYVKSNTSGGAALAVNAQSPCTTHVQWYNSGTPTGSVTTNGASAVSYNTTSDYRLKENIAPMTGALAKVAQLNPVTYKWKLDGANGQGFIAHELQAIVPDCVTGEKDAVDADGNPKYQGIDTSYLVATLTSAIQELKAINDSLTARIVALETK